MSSIQHNSFSKRIYTSRSFLKDAKFLLNNIKACKDVYRSEYISKAFMERLMLVVSSINDCVYCKWYHVKQATEAGLDDAEVNQILNAQFSVEGSSSFEQPALLYAQHYAETEGMVDAEMKQRLLDFYGEEVSKEIHIILRLITYGNLRGNTFDAFMSRLKGVPAQGSNVWFELVFFLFHAPFMLPFQGVVKPYR